MTNSLPAGTRNTSLNLIDEEYHILKSMFGDKLGPSIKKFYLLGLKVAGEAEKVAATQIEAIRAERLRMKHGVALCAIFALALFGGVVEMRRSRTVRGVRAAAMRVVKRANELEAA